MSASRPVIERMAALGAHLMPIKPQLKEPAARGWPLAVALTVDDAAAHADRGGNVGVNLALSRLVVLDAENLAATQALLAAGFTLTVITAKSQDPASPKRGGAHAWLRVPAAIDAMALPANRLSIALPGGGKIDALAGARYVVAPPSRLAEAARWCYAPALGGVLDPDSGAEIPEAPAWLFDRSAAVPPGLEPLHGILIPDSAREKVEADARSIELTDAIDAVSWADWLSGDPRLSDTGQIDGCGCSIWHWTGSSNPKSVTLHAGCAQGSGAHIWSGTMRADLGLDREHVSRLDLTAALRGVTRREAAEAVGIALGAETEGLQGFSPSEFRTLAEGAEAAGNFDAAAAYRAEAAALEDRRVSVAGEIYLPATPAAGANALAAQDDKAAEEARKGVTRRSGKLTIRSFPGLSLSEIGPPAEDEFNEYPMPPIPEHVAAVVGAKTEMWPVQPPLANRMGHENVTEEWIFHATPGLSHIAAAADSRGVSRWGMLGALLPRLAATVPPTVRLTPANRVIPSDPGATGAGTSINIFSVLVGPPASGKTDTMSAAATLIPGLRIVAPGTGEGVLKEFPRPDDDADAAEGGAGSSSAPAVADVGAQSPDAVLLESDEIDVFIGEMLRQGSKTTGWYRQMWMGGDVGNTASDRDRRSFVAAHTYRFGILLGAQPETVSSLFNEAGRGTPQRFMWLTAHQTPPRGPEYPQRLATAPVYWFGGRPSMIPNLGGNRPPVWITPPPAAIESMDVERARAATANPFDSAGRYGSVDVASGAAEAIANRHAVLQQLKVCVLLAALDGLAQPQDTHWYAAGAVMAVRRRNIEHLATVAERLWIDDKRKRGRDQGIMQANAKAANESETRDRRNEVSAQVLREIAAINSEKRAITRTEICTRVAQHLGTADFVPDALSNLMSRGYLVQIDADTYEFNCTRDSGPSATVSVLVPRVSSVGG